MLERRPEPARALAQDLQRYIDGEPILGRRVSLLGRLRRRVRRNRALFALGMVTTLLALGSGGLGLYMELQARRQAALAQPELALQARDNSRFEEAVREFKDAVRNYEAAARAGQSDAAVYESLAEAWARQVEMARNQGQPTEQPLAQAIAASDKLTAVEPQSIAGPLKRAFATMLAVRVERVFAINPNHARGWSTQGALALLRAQTERVAAARQTAARAAVQAFERALMNDPLLSHEDSAHLEAARH